MPFTISELENMSDNELIHLIHKNNDDSEHITDYFMEKHKKLVLQQARPLFLAGGDKEDLIQEGMIGLYKAVRKFDSNTSSDFIPFAQYVIYKQMCTAITASNRKKYQPLNNYVSLDMPISNSQYDQSNPPLLSEIIVASSNTNPEELIIDKENVSMIEYELGKCLSKLEKAVYQLYIEGMDYKQIAITLGKEPKAIDNALSRIRKKLRNMLS